MVTEERVLITGCNGQLGKALVAQYPAATAMSREKLDISNIKQVEAVDWARYDVVINAAAYVNADHSETVEGRGMTWQANAVGPRNLAKAAIEHDLQLIHISSEYVFDGSKEDHTEDESFTPLSVYGQAKAAGDLAVSLADKHYILRTTWVVGDGHNFVRTMKKLADMRINPKVVNDQFGRLTFVSEIVRAVDYILQNDVPYGTYNVSNAGKVRSWAEIAAHVFGLAGHDKERVSFISTEEYSKEKQPFAPRPVHSELNLSKLQKLGFKSQDYEDLLKEYVLGLGNAE
jgi:dTDP-4-dehydrorhamnose reductase